MSPTPRMGGVERPGTTRTTTRTLRVALSPAERRRNRQGDQVATGLLVGVWLYVVGTPLLGRSIGVDLNLLGELLIACLTVLAAAVVVIWFADLVEAGMLAVAAAVAPACYVTMRAVYSGVIDFHGLTIIVVMLAIAAARPRVAVLHTLAVLLVVATIGALMLGFLRPELAIQMEGGEVTERADKQLLPGLGILTGVSPHGNAMGQLLSMGLPLMILIQRRWVRFTAIGLMLFGLAWTASRGSMLTAAVALALMFGLPLITHRGLRTSVERLAVAAAVFVCAALPWMMGLADDAFSARGGIWRGSTEVWLEQSPIFGLGPQWYTLRTFEASSPVINVAVSGHNQLVQLAVTGGMVLLALALIQTLAFVIATTGRRARHDVLATAVIAGLWVNGWLEYAMGYIDDVPTWPVTFPILAVLWFCRDRVMPESRLTEAAELSSGRRGLRRSSSRPGPRRPRWGTPTRG